MSLIPWYYKLMAVVIGCTAFIIAVGLWNSHEQAVGAAKEVLKYEKILDDQRAEASALLASETRKVLETERILNELRNQREVSDNENKKKVDGLSNSVRILTGAIRLRDPNAHCGQNSGGPKNTVTSNANNSSGDRADAGELLSPELNELLWDQAEKSDRINIAFISCKEDSENIRKNLPKLLVK